MGSVINVSIPTRVYEIQLRLKQGQVVLYKTIEKKLMGTDDAEDDEAEPEEPVVVPLPLTGVMAFKKLSNVSVESVAKVDGEVLPEMNLENITVPAVGKTKDRYIGLSAGRPAEIVITHDTMEIILKKTSKEKLEPEKKDSHTIADEIIKNTFQEKHMEETLTKFTLNHASWRPSIDGNFSIISFSVNTDRSDKVINHIRMLGIGTKYKSKLSVISAVAYLDSGEAKLRELQEAKVETEKPKDENDEDEEKKETNWGKFVSSIRARLTVAQVIQTVESGATITFDFLILILIAGMIAGLGLVENSSVNLVASMLISPLMGPILAQTFGLVIHDYRLARIGLISESTGLSLCLCIGFIFGLFISCKAYKGPWHDVKVWPTPEMQARGQLRGIIVGAMISAPSGAGVALSILGGNAGSLVGVAISASLLPPAVNSGLFCGLALMVYAQESMKGRSIGGCHDYLGDSSDKNNTLAKNEDYIRDYEWTYCQNIVHDFALLGVCSFGLTLVNIVLIIATGYIILKIKEVAPHTTRKSMRRFWKEDLAVMRAYNKSHKNTYRKQVLLNDIKNADNPALIREEVQNDKVFDAVNRRTVFQASNILDDVLREEDLNTPPEPELVFKKMDEKSKAKSKVPSKRPSKKPSKNKDIV